MEDIKEYLDFILVSGEEEIRRENEVDFIKTGGCLPDDHIVWEKLLNIQRTESRTLKTRVFLYGAALKKALEPVVEADKEVPTPAEKEAPTPANEEAPNPVEEVDLSEGRHQARLIIECNPHLEPYYTSLGRTDSPVILIAGEIQSGKTQAILQCAHIGACMGRSSITLVQDNLPLVNQLGHRVDEFNDRRIPETEANIKINTGQDITLPKLKSVVFTAACISRHTIKSEDGEGTKRHIWWEKVNIMRKKDKILDDVISILDPLSPVVGNVILNANVTTLELLSKLVQRLETEAHGKQKMIDFIVDEADMVFSDPTDLVSRKMNVYFSTLQKSLQTMAVTTATPPKLVMNPRCHINAIISLPIPPSYVGIDNIKYEVKRFEGCSALHKRSTQETIDKVERLVGEFVNDILKEPPLNVTIEGEKMTLARNLMIVTTDQTKLQKSEFDCIRNNLYDTPISTAVWNSCHNLMFYSNALTGPGIEVEFKKGVKMSRIDNYYQIDHTKYGVTLGDLMSWMRLNGGYPRFGHFFPITGNYADRGFSMVDREYISHLTGMVYLPSKTTGASSQLQHTRILGVYPDKDQYDITCYTTLESRDTCIKAHMAIRLAIQQIQEKYGGDDLPSDILRDVEFPGFMKDVKFHAKNKHTHHIPNKIPKSQYNMNGDHSTNVKFNCPSEVAMKLHDDCYTLNKYKRSVKGRKIRQKFLDTRGEGSDSENSGGSDSENSGGSDMKIYDHTDLAKNIKKVIKNLRKNSDNKPEIAFKIFRYMETISGEAKKQDILEECDIQSLSNYDKWGTHAQYKVLVNTTGDMYKINEKVRYIADIVKDYCNEQQ